MGEKPVEGVFLSRARAQAAGARTRAAAPVKAGKTKPGAVGLDERRLQNLEKARRKLKAMRKKAKP